MSTLLQLTDLEKSYGSQIIFDKTSLTISKEQKIGVIGRNGAGKSTLLKIIIGEEELDSGEIKIYDKAQIGYLEQNDPFSPEEKVIDFLVRYTKKEAWECGKIASNFQLKNKELNSYIKNLSGGYQMRIKLTGMLLQNPNLLLLDEPTNFLDLSTLLLLEHFLNNYNGGYLVISHDREFLKRTCNSTLDIEHGQLFLQAQGIENYLSFKAKNLKIKEKHNKHIEQQQKHLTRFIDRFRAKASKASQAQSKIKQLERLKPIEINHALARVRIRLPYIKPRKGVALDINNLDIGYSDKLVARNINFSIDHGERIVIVGDNGQGKTTFLKTLMNIIPALNGEFHFVSNTKIGYYAQHIPQSLDPKISVYDYLHLVSAKDMRREEIMEMAGNFLFRDNDLNKKIKVLSGGEKSRLCLAGLLLQKDNCLFLDEPSNHLDFETVEALAIALQEYQGTILLISHNRTFVHTVATGVVEIENGQVNRYHSSYDEYVNLLEQRTDVIDEIVNHDLKKTKKYSNNYTKIKLMKKRLRKIEQELVNYENNKNELELWFKKNPTEYNIEKYQKNKEINEKIESLELQWLEIQEDLH